MAPRASARSKFHLSTQDLRDVWPLLSASERLEGFRSLDRTGAEDFMLSLSSAYKAQLILSFPEIEERTWIRYLPPDDVADVIQAVTAAEQKERLLCLIDDPTRKQVSALLAYAEDEAGGLMNPLFIRLRPGVSVDEAIGYLRKQTHQRSGSIYYAYVLDPEQHLLGVISFRQLLAAPGDHKVEEIMKKDLIFVLDNTDQEAVSRLFEQHKLMAIPVLDDDHKMKGIVTLDDIINVVQKEATEDIQKIGGMEALDEPYLQINLFKMIKKRAGWLILLFISEMFTTSAMTHYGDEMVKVTVLAFFIPLIISSGGNSGSQASTLVIRAMALGEVRLSDWFRVLFREIRTGLALGCILAPIGFLRIVLWPHHRQLYTDHFMLIALTIALSLIGIVLWGSIIGSILPILMRKLGFDPASASAPFVATMVDVTGIVIYFNVAMQILGRAGLL